MRRRRRARGGRRQAPGSARSRSARAVRAAPDRRAPRDRGARSRSAPRVVMLCSVTSVARDLLDHPAAREDQDAVAEPLQLQRVRRGDHDRLALVRRACGGSCRSRGARRHRRPGRARRRGARSARSRSARAITDFCWLPPESDSTGVVERGRLDRERRHLALYRGALLTAAHEARHRETGEGREPDVLANRQRQQRLAMAVARDVENACRVGGSGVARPHPLAARKDPSPCRGGARQAPAGTRAGRCPRCRRCR